MKLFGQQTNRYVAAAIIIAAALISASILYATSEQSTITETETTTLTVTPTTSTMNTSVEADILATCSHANPAQFPELVVSTNITTVLCVQVYDYNYASLYALNVSRALDIEALTYPPNSQPVVFSGAPNFTVIASPNELVIGGPHNENEGAVIAYALTAKPGASGTYELNFPSFSYLLPGLEDCGYYGEIVAGNGEPSYLNTGFSGCIGYTISFATGQATNSTKYTIIDNRVLYNGDIYFQISDVANYTQIGAIG